MIRNYIVSLVIGAGLTACSSLLYQSDKQYALDDSQRTSVEIDSLVAPYARELKKEMNVVIGNNKQDLLVERPNSGLGQWICDRLVAFGKDSLSLDGCPVVSLLNTGGLRSPLSKGPVTVGNIFQVMPFDNRIVALKLSTERLPEIEAYLKLKGGEPVSGMKVVKGKLSLNDPATSCFWVVTSDFLANGGDNMLFFKTYLDKRETMVLLRDFLINAVKKQQNIDFSAEERINW